MLGANRQRLRLQSFYYYTWISVETYGAQDFAFAGLIGQTSYGRVFTKPALAAFSKGALALEHCKRKSSNAHALRAARRLRRAFSAHSRIVGRGAAAAFKPGGERGHVGRGAAVGVADPVPVLAVVGVALRRHPRVEQRARDAAVEMAQRPERRDQVRRAAPTRARSRRCRAAASSSRTRSRTAAPARAPTPRSSPAPRGAWPAAPADRRTGGSRSRRCGRADRGGRPASRAGRCRGSSARRRARGRSGRRPGSRRVPARRARRTAAAFGAGVQNWALSGSFQISNVWTGSGVNAGFERQNDPPGP